MDNPRTPWTNIWTLAISGTGILILLHSIISPPAILRFEACWGALTILSLAFLVAAWQIYRATLVDADGHHLHEIQDPGRFYLQALKLLASHKWLPGLFISIAALNILGIVTSELLGRWLRPGMVALHASHHITLNESLRSFPFWVRNTCTNAPTNLLPSLKFNPSGGIVLEVVLSLFALAVIMFSARKSIPSEPKAKKGFHAILWLIVMLALASTALDGYQLRQLAQERPAYSKSFSGTNTLPAQALAKPELAQAVDNNNLTTQKSGQFSGKRTVNPFSLMGMRSLLWHPAVSILFTALMMGGILGTLKRGRVGEQAALTTFIEDSWRYFAPLALIYFLAWLFNTREFIYPFLQSFRRHHTPAFILQFLELLRSIMQTFSTAAYLLLMISPCIVVSSDYRGWESVKAGSRLWISKSSDIMPFAAFGITLYTATVIIVNTLYILICDQWSWYSSATIVAEASARLIMTFFAIVTTLAVWELTQELLSVKETNQASLEPTG